MDRIDFRSDTVSWPTPTMRQAMAQARVGDDVYGEDPTVNELQEMAASMVGKEAALFVASGTMGNLAAILTHAGRGDEAIVGIDAHTYCWEAGGMATLGGIVPHPLPTDRYGRLDMAQVAASVRSEDAHLPHSRLILVENSYGGKNGYPLAPEYFAQIRAVADQYGLAVHMDGARLFNAAVALNIDASELTKDVDSVSFCLSKGLSAPVGSMLCGSRAFIKQAHRMRKSLGGGMRQAGILAAAGKVALCEMVDRLTEDHKHAQMLAQGLAQNPGIVVDAEMVRTNIVYFRLHEEVSLGAAEIAETIKERANIWIGANGPHNFRAVTHYWIKRTDVEMLLQLMDELVGKP